MALPKYENFDFFDQFKDIEVDLSKYLENFSTKDYELKFSNLQPVRVTIKNLFEQFRLVENFKRDTASLQKYRIIEEERLDTLSYRFYETVDFWWVIAIFNNIRNPFFDLPLTEAQIIQLAEQLFEREGKYTERTYYDLIFEANEDRREIIIPNRTSLGNIIWAFRREVLRYGGNNVNA